MLQFGQLRVQIMGQQDGVLSVEVYSSDRYTHDGLADRLYELGLIESISPPGGVGLAKFDKTANKTTGRFFKSLLNSYTNAISSLFNKITRYLSRIAPPMAGKPSIMKRNAIIIISPRSPGIEYPVERERSGILASTYHDTKLIHNDPYLSELLTYKVKDAIGVPLYRQEPTSANIPDLAIMATPSANIPDLATMATPSANIPDLATMATPSANIADLATMATPSANIPDLATIPTPGGELSSIPAPDGVRSSPKDRPTTPVTKGAAAAKTPPLQQSSIEPLLQQPAPAQSPTTTSPRHLMSSLRTPPRAAAPVSGPPVIPTFSDLTNGHHNPATRRAPSGFGAIDIREENNVSYCLPDDSYDLSQISSALGEAVGDLKNRRSSKGLLNFEEIQRCVTQSLPGLNRATPNEQERLKECVKRFVDTAVEIHKPELKNFMEDVVTKTNKEVNKKLTKLQNITAKRSEDKVRKEIKAILEANALTIGLALIYLRETRMGQANALTDLYWNDRSIEDKLRGDTTFSDHIRQVLLPSYDRMLGDTFSQFTTALANTTFPGNQGAGRQQSDPDLATSSGERVSVTKSGWPLNRGQIPLISFYPVTKSGCH
eukprot:sb/3463175/